MRTSEEKSRKLRSIIEANHKTSDAPTPLIDRETRGERQQGKPGGRRRPGPEEPSMQPIPGCRIRVWKREWRQTVGSQTSLTTGTRRIANRVEPRSRRRKEGGDTTGGGERRMGGVEIKRWEAERLMVDLTAGCG